MPLKLHNTLSREKEEFSPIEPGKVGMYTCGPTVYNYAHIGNLRSYVFADILHRTLKYLGYEVKQIMNITDIGHLSSDADSGEDKMTKGLLREGKALTLRNMRELAEFYTDRFKEDLEKLNIEMPNGLYFASDYVAEDIELIKKLEEKGFAYKITDGIYFNISKMPNYGILWGGIKNKKDSQTRIGENSEKKNPEDFALWKFDSKIGFESPWGMGFPGWHIECSAMGIKFLGEQFDIHTGGIDHIPVHHTNEIAQSESATGKVPFVKFWLHHEHVDISGAKMAKSEGNFLRLGTLIENNINPLSYRFLLLMAHYRTKMNYNDEAIKGAEIALKRLYGRFLGLGEAIGKPSSEYLKKFKEYIENDLDTPEILTLLWDVLKDENLANITKIENLSNADKKATILEFDKVLGLGFDKLKVDIIPEEIKKLATEREEARKNKDWNKSDDLRNKINSLGYEIEDKDNTYKINKN
jgi:cysteinyl-tRNA synthetase